ncbi:MAG: ATP-dependent RNA helicase HrpA, partial [Deltaproteobacteria bacterium]|nr:ATP-dependent RNA helicase HrpA [Deltaproteobacteria bacterium]
LLAELRKIRKIVRGEFVEQSVVPRVVRLENRLSASINRRRQRLENCPVPAYNEDLPIIVKREEIVEAISKNRVVIISGATGSGKTTQIPKFCLAAGRGIDGMIGCTQPRRIAAITVAARIAEEMGEDIGQSVGYKIRFADKSGSDPYIKIMTDGILLAETLGDRFLNAYDTLIVDEAHERSLNIDFVLGILKNLLKRRRDMKLLITSATIDTRKFSKAFDNAPIIEVSGRIYPVQVRYETGHAPDEEDDAPTYVEKAVRALDTIQMRTPFGDILVFMPTEQDIRETCEILCGRGYHQVTVLPLFGRLSAAEQTRVFKSAPGRKIIVATNVAETSITIPGIRYVVDTGLARISHYSPRTRTTALPVMPVSRSSADQRKGRCGRVSNGVCIRLYSEEEYNDRVEFTLPEILRSNLAEVILRMISLNLGDIAGFPFIDKPAPKSIKDGFDILMEFGAIQKATAGKKGRAGKGQKHSSGHGTGSGDFVLSPKGRVMARLPIDPRLSRMLIQAHDEGCVPSMTVIAAVLSIQDPRERPVEKAKSADQARALFNDPASDFVTLLNIWKAYQAARRTGKKSGQITKQIKKFCMQYFLSFRRMREWYDIHAQLADILQENGLCNSHSEIVPKHGVQLAVAAPKDSKQPKNAVFGVLYTAIHKSIVSGFLSNIALKKEQHIFKGTKGREPMIFPGSNLFKSAGNWIVAAEMLETSRLYARTVANIDSDWLEELARKQCRYTYLEPHWERSREEVTAYEQVSLYGLVLVSRRPVSYGRINPDEASDIFIRSALVEEDVRQVPGFMQHNRKLIQEIEGMENRVRRRDILVDPEDIFLFYREHLAGIYDLRTLRKYIKTKGGDGFLKLTREFLLRRAPDENELELYPDRVTLGNRSFVCDYCFEPGHAKDGVTVSIPAAVAAAVPSDAMDWLVPGFFKEKITALIKGLPKIYRKRLVPAAGTAAIIAREMQQSDKSLFTALGEFIHARFNVDIPAAAWPVEELPEHLRLRIALIDHKGKQVCAGRDKSILTRDISMIGVSDVMTKARKKWEKTGVVKWDFGDLPETVVINGADNEKWEVWPGLEPDENCVNLRVFESRSKALASHEKGVVRLYTLYFAKDLKYLKKSLQFAEIDNARANYLGGSKKLLDRLYAGIVHDLFCKNIRRQADFNAHAASAGPRILERGQQMLQIVSTVLEAVHEVRTLFSELENVYRRNPVILRIVDSARAEVTRLAPETFIEIYAAKQLIHLPRYIRAIGIRAQRAGNSPEKNLVREKLVNGYTDHL